MVPLKEDEPGTAGLLPAGTFACRGVCTLTKLWCLPGRQRSWITRFSRLEGSTQEIGRRLLLSFPTYIFMIAGGICWMTLKPLHILHGCLLDSYFLDRLRNDDNM